MRNSEVCGCGMITEYFFKALCKCAHTCSLTNYYELIKSEDRLEFFFVLPGLLLTSTLGERGAGLGRTLSASALAAVECWAFLMLVPSASHTCSPRVSCTVKIWNSDTQRRNQHITDLSNWNCISRNTCSFVMPINIRTHGKNILFFFPKEKLMNSLP